MTESRVDARVAPELPSGTATFLFTDIEGSTKLVQKVGAGWHDLLEEHNALMRAAFEPEGGVEVKTEGDAFFVAFASAIGAVAACKAAQRALAEHTWPADAPIRVRMGVHTGEAKLQGRDYIGFDIHRVARIVSTAHGGQVILSASTRALVESQLPPDCRLRDMGEHRLKDLAQPEHLYQLDIDGLQTDFPALKSLDNVPNNLPTQLTSFVGREQELEKARNLMENARLLTLTGPGGTGKTRMSMQLAADISEGFKDGVFWVPLAPISDPDLVPSTILQTLGFPDPGSREPQDALVEQLKGKELLLVLDNFEQILPAARYVGEILQSDAGVKVITSSRAPLKVYGEQEFPVPPLGLPDPHALPPPESLGQFEAVKLFIDRAVAIKPDFQVTNENAPAVAGICALVDGLPLAIELAAARIRLLPPQAMLTRLETHLGELGGGARNLPERQQTLRGAIAWSYDMLSSDAQRLFAALAVFVRGGTLEDVEAIVSPCIAGIDIFEGLENLVEQSLLRQIETEAEARFFLLHVIREFALERFNALPEAATLRERHAEHYLALAEKAEPYLLGPDQKEWLDHLDREQDNLRAALGYFVEQGAGDAAGRMLFSLWRFWQMRGHLREARQHVESVLALSDLANHPETHYNALEAAGGIFYWLNDADATDEHYLRALEIARELGEPGRLAGAIYNAAFIGYVFDRDRDVSMQRFQEAARMYDELHDTLGSARAKWGIAGLLTLMADFDHALPWAEQALEAFRGTDDRFGLGWSLHQVAQTTVHLGKLDRAKEALHEAIEMFAAAGDQSAIALILGDAADIAITSGDALAGARFTGAGQRLQEATGADLASNVSLQRIDPSEKLSKEEFEKALAEGWAWSTEQVIQHALELTTA